MKQFNTISAFLLLMIFSVMGFANSTNKTFSPPDCSLVSNDIGDFIYLGEYNDSKYYCSNTSHHTWHEAKAAAESYGGHLAIVDNASENEFIRSSILADYVWLGLTDEASEGNFITTLGDSPSYLNWNSGEPNNSNGQEHYVRLLRDNGKWTDRNEWFEAEFVMEIPCPNIGNPPNNDACTNRTASNVINCNTGLNYGGWLKVSGFETDYSISNAHLVENNDGTAIFTGTWTNNDYNNLSFDFEIWATGKTNNAPANSPKEHYCLNPNYSDFYYYQDFTGVLTGKGYAEGAKISISSFGAAFQLGVGANATGEDNVFGASAWYQGYLFQQPTNGNTISLNPNSNGHLGDINIELTGGPNDCEACDGGDDSDNDGICDAVDCAPQNPNLPTIPGTSCNDGNNNTQNDVIQADGCTCAGSSNPTNGNLTVDAGLDQDICSDESVTLTATAADQAVCPLPCDLSNEQLISTWDMEDCASFSNDGSGGVYTEFTPDENDLSCASVLASSLYRFDGMHSCTDDSNNGDAGDAVCLGMNGSSFQNDADKALRFDITIDPSNCLSGITKLTFKDFAPSTYLWSAEGYNDNTGTNNYPTKFGIRVLKNGVEIFKQTGLNTSTGNWNMRTFDFSDNPEFQDSDIALYQFELLAYDLVGNGGSVSAWDLDNIKIFGGTCSAQTNNEISYLWSNGATTPTIDVDQTGDYCVTVTDCSGAEAADCVNISETPVEGGQLTFDDGSTDTSICIDDTPDPLFVSLNGSVGSNTAWVITDEDLNILGLPAAPPFDLNGAGVGTCLIWNVSFETLQGAELGLNAADLTGCFDLSNPIAVIREVCIDPVNIGDKVFFDDNNNGIQDTDEGGVENVTVRLISAGPDGLFHTDDDVTEAVELTDGAGEYQFDDVNPGVYCIEFAPATIPAGFEFTTRDATNDALDSDADEVGKTDPFEVVNGQDDTFTYDAGIFDPIDPVNIGDKVFYDEDKDGIQDGTEEGVEDVTVRLISAGPDGEFHTDDDVTEAVDVTDENGAYGFEDVLPGVYCIEFAPATIPNGFVFTEKDATNDTNDSDADEVGKTDPFLIEDGQDDDLTFDAGIFDPICEAVAGTMLADEAEVEYFGGNVIISATPNGDALIPAGFNQIFVLTQGDDLVIIDAGADAQFAVSELGKYTIHSLVFDPNTLDLNIIDFGTTTGFDVNALLEQGGGDICAALDVAGAMIFLVEPFNPGINIDDVTVNEEDGTAILKICLDEVADEDVTVDFTTADGSALEGEDYTAQEGTATILAGELCAMVMIEILDDLNPEDTEELTVTLSNPSVGELTDDEGTVTILDTDVVFPKINIDDVIVNEEDGTAILKVCLDEATTVDVSADFMTGNVSAGEGTDYVGNAGTVTIPAGELCAMIMIEILDDENPEDTEEFLVNLVNPVNGELDDAQGVVTILDTDVIVPNISIDDVIVNEEDGTAVLKVCLDEATSVDVSVEFATGDDSALQGSDYAAQSGTVTIPAGELCAMIMIDIIDDENPEDTEALVVNLSNPTNGELADDQGTINILDTDVVIPGITIDDVVVNEEDGTAVLKICLDEATTVDVSVDYATGDFSALEGEDYTGQEGTVTIEAGELCAMVMIEILDDENPEDTEELTVTLSNPTNSDIVDEEGTITILDSDVIIPGISIDDVTVNEEDGTAVLKICLDEATTVDVTVDYATGDDSALQGSDYAAQSGTVTILAGELCAMVMIDIIDDENPEDTEELVVNLSNPTNGELTDDQGTVTILDTDVVIPGITIDDVVVNEEDGTAVLKICLDEATSVDVSVDYATGDFSALEGEDYTGQEGTVTIEAGELCAMVMIEILDDENPEDTEELGVRLSNPTNSDIVDDEGTITILDTDVAPLPNLDINDITVNEEDGTATLEICLDATSDEDVTVDFATADGSAIEGNDYTSVSGTLTIEAGELCAEVTIPLVDDEDEEDTEELVVNLSNPSNAELADDQGTVTILDTDEAPLPSLDINDITVNEEDGTATLEICLDAASDEDVTVDFGTADGSAIEGDDYTSVSGTLTIEAGELCAEVTVPVLDDEDPESTEELVVNLSNPSGADLADDQGTITILDTDQPTGGCDDILIEEVDGTITTSGYSDPIVFVKVYDANWNNVYDSGMITDNAEQVIAGLPAGEYWVFVKTYDNSWTEICDIHETIVIEETGGDLPKLSINDITVNEEDGLATLAICLDEVADEDVTVVYTTNDGSALEGDDYIAGSATVTIPAGMLCMIIDLPIVDDEDPENTENFEVILSDPTGATILDGTGVVTILDTDTPADGCSAIYIEASDATITVGGYTDPIAFVKVYDSSWNLVYNSGMLTNGETQTITVTETDTYWVFVKTYDLSWNQLCDVHETFNIICGNNDPCVDLGGDTDGDGVCDDNDICPLGDDNADADGDGIPDACDTVDPEICIEREVSSTDLCAGDADYSFFIRFENTHYYYQFIDDATFTEYTDGTALLTGTIENNEIPGLKFEVEVTYSGRTAIAPANSPKEHLCLSADEDLFYYYPTLEGILTGIDDAEGAVISMSEFGPAFQVGLGGNVTSSTLDYGASGWMAMEVLSQPNAGNPFSFEASTDGQGDVNIMLSGDYEECLNVGITAPATAGPISSCNVEITSGDGTMTIGGYTQPVAIIQVFDAQWTPVFSCMGDCAMPLVIDDLQTGTYFVKVSLYDDNWNMDCEETEGYYGVVNSLGLESASSEFLFFQAQKDGRDVSVNWTTNTEYKNDHFVVERSVDGLNFNPVFDVNSIKDDNAATYYQDKDADPLTGKSFYRLKQVYADGTYRYSNMKPIEFDFELLDFSVYPNPTTDKVFINLKEFAGEAATIDIYNALGEKMSSFDTETLGEDAIEFNVSEFKGGMYSISAQVENRKVMTRLFVVVRK